MLAWFIDVIILIAHAVSKPSCLMSIPPHTTLAPSHPPNHEYSTPPMHARPPAYSAEKKNMLLAPHTLFRLPLTLVHTMHRLAHILANPTRLGHKVVDPFAEVVAHAVVGLVLGVLEVAVEVLLQT